MMWENQAEKHSQLIPGQLFCLAQLMHCRSRCGPITETLALGFTSSTMQNIITWSRAAHSVVSVHIKQASGYGFGLLDKLCANGKQPEFNTSLVLLSSKLLSTFSFNFLLYPVSYPLRVQVQRPQIYTFVI